MRKQTPPPVIVFTGYLVILGTQKDRFPAICVGPVVHICWALTNIMSTKHPMPVPAVKNDSPSTCLCREGCVQLQKFPLTRHSKKILTAREWLPSESCAASPAYVAVYTPTQEHLDFGCAIVAILTTGKLPCSSLRIRSPMTPRPFRGIYNFPLKRSLPCCETC